MIQRWWRAKQDRLNLLSVKRFILKLQCLARGYLAREKFRNVKIKHAHARVASEQKRRNEAAVKIQSYWKMYLVLKGRRTINSMAIVIQRAWRCYKIRKEKEKKEKFSTMKKMAALPELSEKPRRNRSSSGKRNQSADVEIDKKKEPRWNIPNQMVDVRPVVRPPINSSSEPYQAKVPHF